MRHSFPDAVLVASRLTFTNTGIRAVGSNRLYGVIFAVVGSGLFVIAVWQRATAGSSVGDGRWVLLTFGFLMLLVSVAILRSGMSLHLDAGGLTLIQVQGGRRDTYRANRDVLQGVVVTTRTVSQPHRSATAYDVELRLAEDRTPRTIVVKRCRNGIEAHEIGRRLASHLRIPLFDALGDRTEKLDPRTGRQIAHPDAGTAAAEIPASVDLVVRGRIAPGRRVWAWAVLVLVLSEAIAAVALVWLWMSDDRTIRLWLAGAVAAPALIIGTWIAGRALVVERIQADADGVRVQMTWLGLPWLRWSRRWPDVINIRRQTASADGRGVAIIDAHRRRLLATGADDAQIRELVQSLERLLDRFG